MNEWNRNKLMKRIMKRIPSSLIMGLPIFFLMLLGKTQPIRNPEPIPPECKLSKWDLPNLPNYLPSSFAKAPPILVPRSAIPCCQQDVSCQDDMAFRQDKISLLASVQHSLQYLQSERALKAYEKYPITGITRDRVTASLVKFQQLLRSSHSAPELTTAIAKNFVFYQSVGQDASGKVLFTAYYEPVYLASRTPTPEFRYPVYRRPPDLSSWSLPHPTRLELEGADGLQGEKGKLKGLELFWLRDRLEPFLIQIEGSARLKLTDGTETSIGYNSDTGVKYKSIGRELIKDGKLPKKGVNMPMIIDYFHKYPQELNIYLPRNPSFVFFQENHGAPATGCLNQPLTAERSIATDKSLMPPGALAFIHATIPFADRQNNSMDYRTVGRYVLDQDTGGAIKGAGRVDYFLGTGKIAGDRAGLTVSDGQLFYLLLKSKN